MKFVNFTFIFAIPILFGFSFLVTVSSAEEQDNQKIFFEKLIDDEKYSEVLDHSNNNLVLNPEDEVALFYKGLAYFHQSEYFLALSVFDTVNEKNPKNAEGFYYKARTFYSLDEFKNALESIDEAIKLDEKNSSYLSRKGLILKQMGEYYDAIRYYNQALEIDPDNTTTLNRKGVALKNLGFYDAAIENYDKALEINPKKESALYNKGRSLLLLERFDESIIYFDKALEINPEKEMAIFYKGVALFNLEKYEESSEYMTLAYSMGRDFDDVYEVISNLYVAEDHSLAINFYDNLLEHNPENITILVLKSYALLTLGLYDESIATLDQSLKLMPDSFELISLKGIVLFLSGNDAESVEYFDKALKLSNDTKIQNLRDIAHLQLDSKNKSYQNQEYGYELEIPENWITFPIQNTNHDDQILFKDGFLPRELILYKPFPPMMIIGSIEQNPSSIKDVFFDLEKLEDTNFDSDKDLVLFFANLWDLEDIGSFILGEYTEYKITDFEIISNQDYFEIEIDLDYLDDDFGEKIVTKIVFLLYEDHSIFFVYLADSNLFEQHLKEFTISIDSISLEKNNVLSKSQIIPKWIKTNAEWWSEDKIDDSTFVLGIQFLIENGILSLADTPETVSDSSVEIPVWIKTNAEFWAKGLISDEDFLNGIQYLVQHGIIKV